MQGVQPILVVEDSPEDYELTQEAFRLAGFRNPLHRVCDGEEALDYYMETKSVVYARDNSSNG